MDESARGKPEPTCIEGVLRDDKGIVLKTIVASVGVRYSNKAEIIAIVFVLELYLDPEIIKSRNLAI